jgi:hypothetical protein
MVNNGKNGKQWYKIGKMGKNGKNGKNGKMVKNGKKWSQFINKCELDNLCVNFLHILHNKFCQIFHLLAQDCFNKVGYLPVSKHSKIRREPENFYSRIGMSHLYTSKAP